MKRPKSRQQVRNMLTVAGFNRDARSLTADESTPKIAKQPAVNFRDEGRKFPRTVGNLIQPAIARFELKRHGFNRNALTPPQRNRTRERVVVEVDDVRRQYG